MSRNAIEVVSTIQDDILNQNLDPGHVFWRHYQTCLMSELEVKSGILKEMLMLRDSHQEKIFNKEEVETVIQFVCLDFRVC